MDRRGYFDQIVRALRVTPSVALIGPRQCGKTTLARQLLKQKKTAYPSISYFDLERQEDLARLQNAELTLTPLRGLVVIDEVQRLPGLFETLRVLLDRRPLPSRFLLLGSASRDLLRQSSESLAGRISYIEVTPLQLVEVKSAKLDSLWVRGGFPPSFLARDNKISYDWRQAYISTYLERDIPALGFQIPPVTMRRFWMMLIHLHGQIFNASELGSSLGISHPTVRRYLDILNGTFMVRTLTPWLENLEKRQVKQPKIFFRDSGILHALMGLRTLEELRNHPKLGASWEGFALEATIQSQRAQQENCYFWGTHNQAELDLLIVQDGRKRGYEIKFNEAPRLSRSMRIAMEDLKLDSLTVVYPGHHRYPLADGIEAVPLTEISSPRFKHKPL